MREFYYGVLSKRRGPLHSANEFSNEFCCRPNNKMLLHYVSVLSPRSVPRNLKHKGL